MKTELQNKLLNKYPQFFRTDRKIYTGEKSMNEEIIELRNQKEMVTPIQFGFECGNGWYTILDELMGEIQNHIENVNRNRKYEFKYKWMWNLSYKLRIRTSAKQKNLRAIGEWIYEKAPRVNKPDMTINISQIKEKFGGLCFYISGGDNYIDGLISMAEAMSYQTCEICGSTKNVGKTEGWITVMCEDCYNNHRNKDRLIWERNSKLEI